MWFMLILKVVSKVCGSERIIAIAEQAQILPLTLLRVVLGFWQTEGCTISSRVLIPSKQNTAMKGP